MATRSRLYEVTDRENKPSTSSSFMKKRKEHLKALITAGKQCKKVRLSYIFFRESVLPKLSLFSATYMP
jgi:hypothetical protein